MIIWLKWRLRWLREWHDLLRERFIAVLLRILYWWEGMTMELTRVEERKIEEFILRYKNRPVPRDNASLVAGSPMYYYCKACGKFLTALPEEHIRPAPKYCEDCEDLKNEALLAEALRRISAQQAG